MSFGLLLSLAGSHGNDVMSNLIHVTYQENMSPIRLVSSYLCTCF